MPAGPTGSGPPQNPARAPDRRQRPPPTARGCTWDRKMFFQGDHHDASGNDRLHHRCGDLHHPGGGQPQGEGVGQGECGHLQQTRGFQCRLSRNRPSTKRMWSMPKGTTCTKPERMKLVKVAQFPGEAETFDQASGRGPPVSASARLERSRDPAGFTGKQHLDPPQDLSLVVVEKQQAQFGLRQGAGLIARQAREVLQTPGPGQPPPDRRLL